MNIRNKLVIVLWGISLLAFAAAFVGLLVYQNLTIEDRARAVMEPYAKFISVGADAAVAFEDPIRAQEIIETLQANEQIIDAAIVMNNGRVLAALEKKPVSEFEGRRYALQTILVEDKYVAMIGPIGKEAHYHLAMSRAALSEQERQAMVFFVIGALILAAVTIMQMTILRKEIINPISTLTDAIDKVRTGADYSLQVPASGNDEVGRLGGGFNAMISAIQERESELQKVTIFQKTILENAAYGIVSTDINGIVTSYNPAAEAMMGYAEGEVVGNMTPVTWHDDGELKVRARELSRQFGEKIEAGFDVFTLRAEHAVRDESEWTIHRKDGTIFPALISITALRNEKGEIVGYLGMLNDLTERKQAEDELRRYKDHLEEEVQQRTEDLMLAIKDAEAANQAKSVFLANMSHEFRTPLNAILGFSDLMNRNPNIPNDEKQNIEIISRSGTHLLSLINDVLEMAKIEAGRIQIKQSVLNLEELVHDVIDMMHVRAEEEGLELEVDYSSALPGFIYGDEARLRQVLINIISNAIKYTEVGNVQVRAFPKPDHPELLMFEVKDTGIGIDKENINRIFEPFVQIGEHGISKGTGLGLTITREFVKMMGGEIALESESGKGTVFTVELPLLIAPDVESDSKRIPARDVIGLEPGQPVYRVLIVEDQRDNQLLLTRLMEKVGFSVKVADSGEQGIQDFIDWKPHFVWMDRRMPAMDGLDAAKKIRELPYGDNAKIVIVTASALIEERNEVLNAGLDGYVRKPYRPSELYECMRNLLGVKFIYTDANTGSNEAPFAAKMLQCLPKPLRDEMKAALESLDTQRIRAVIGQVEPYDSRLKSVLENMIASFEYPVILEALAKLEGN